MPVWVQIMALISLPSVAPCSLRGNMLDTKKMNISHMTPDEAADHMGMQYRRGSQLCRRKNSFQQRC